MLRNLGKLISSFQTLKIYTSCTYPCFLVATIPNSFQHTNNINNKNITWYLVDRHWCN